MQKISDARINMQRTTAQFYTDNKEDLDTVPAITENFVTYNANLDIINTELPDALNDPTVDAGIAEKRKADLAKAAEKVALGGAAYADAIKDANLFQIMNVRASYLVNEKKDRLPTTCEQIHAEALKLENALEPYNVKKADLDALKDAIPAYTSAANSPRLSHGNVKAATDAVNTHLKLNDELLKIRLDRLVQTLASTKPALVLGWKNARKLVNPPTKHTSLLVTVLSPGGTPVEAAAVKLVKGTKQYNGVTDETGKFTFKPIAFGELALTVEAPDHQPYSLNKLKVKRGEENALEVRLQLLA